MESYTLRSLPARGVERALAKAEQYRALNEPEDAESICRDVLALEPTLQPALVLLGLSLTDQFPKAGSRLLDETVAVFQRLDGEYERAYYVGITWERCAKAHHDHGQVRLAVHAFERALSFFEKAIDLAPADVPDPVLRWNTCVRALHNDEALRAALGPRPEPAYDVGD